MPGYLRTVPWYGGKYRLLKWLLPKLPITDQYCEPFGGGAVVLVNRPPVHIETYNDLNGDLVNFWRVLRDQRDLLVNKLYSTPYSREEFEYALEHLPSVTQPLERARLFFTCLRQSFSAVMNSWAYKVSGIVKGGGYAWNSGIAILDEIANRLMPVQIENRPAIKVIEMYDDKQTTLYCDPPYLHESRVSDDVYKYEMTSEEHIELSEILSAVEGKVAISGYPSELYNELYKNWQCHTMEHTMSANTDENGICRKVTECLWTNYDPRKVSRTIRKRSSF